MAMTEVPTPYVASPPPKKKPRRLLVSLLVALVAILALAVAGMVGSKVGDKNADVVPKAAVTTEVPALTEAPATVAPTTETTVVPTSPPTTLPPTTMAPTVPPTPAPTALSAPAMQVTAADRALVEQVWSTYSHEMREAMSAYTAANEAEAKEAYLGGDTGPRGEQHWYVLHELMVRDFPEYFAD